jgi:hypothetical protein
MEDICSAGAIEHVGPSEKPRKSLAVSAIADEPEAFIRRNLVCDALYAATLATKREMMPWVLLWVLPWVLSHDTHLADTPGRAV